MFRLQWFSMILQTGCCLYEFGACCIAIFMHGFTAKGSPIHCSRSVSYFITFCAISMSVSPGVYLHWSNLYARQIVYLHINKVRSRSVSLKFPLADLFLYRLPSHDSITLHNSNLMILFQRASFSSIFSRLLTKLKQIPGISGINGKSIDCWIMSQLHLTLLSVFALSVLHAVRS